MKVVFLRPEDHWLLCEEIEYIPTPSLQVLAVVDVEDDMITEVHGMIGMDNWTTNSVHVHIVVKSPLATRMLARACFDYVTENGRNVFIGIVPGDKEKALRLNKAFGFKEVYRVKDGNEPGVDTVIMEMRADEFRLRRAA